MADSSACAEENGFLLADTRTDMGDGVSTHQGRPFGEPESFLSNQARIIFFIDECFSRENTSAGASGIVFKGILSGGATSDTLKIQPNDDIGPIFRSCLMDVSCNISATT